MKKIFLRNFFGALAILFSSLAMAQNQTVSGTVTDESGPLPGATVAIKGTSTGTTTDFDGNYTLNDVPSDAVIVFSFVGYETQEIAVSGRSTIDVNLATDASELEEVILIGYGQTTIKDATGAVSSVTSDEFNQGVIASPEQLIQGKSAGVQITQNSGEPGGGISVRIRGTNSIRSNNNPLFVVDGVPLPGGNTSGEGVNIGFGSSPSKNPLNFLNPNDIESVSILKDASATAIYGSRGSNGVVIITTKKGRGSGHGFEFSSNLAVSSVAEEYDLLSAEQFLAETERLGLNVGERDFGDSTDWQDYIFRTTFSHNENLAYSYNHTTGSIRATLGYQDQQGIIEDSELERITGRINATQRLLDDKLELGLQATISNVEDQSPPLSGGAGFRGDLLGAAYSANPTWPTDPDFDGTGGLLSPANALEYVRSTNDTDRFLLNLSAEYDILEELSAKINFGYDKSDSRGVQVASPLSQNFDQGASGNGLGAVSDLELENRLLELTLNYIKEFGESSLDAVVGYSWQDFNTQGRNVNAFGFNTNDLGEMRDAILSSASAFESTISGSYQQYGYAPNLDQAFINRLFPNAVRDNVAVPSDLAVNTIFTDTFDNTDELQSFFGRINYSLLDKYLFTATLRVDGSSRFGENNRYAAFPSGAFAWKIDQEDFINEETFSTLKLRLGYGITGNQEGLGYGNFVRRERYGGGDVISDGGDINVPGTVAVAFPEPDLKWEETTQYSAGIDFGFDNDRLNGSLDFYRKETTDLLFRIPSAQPAVQDFIFRNLPNSEVLNQGVEFAINYNFFDTEEFGFDANFNISYNENEVTSLQGEYPAGTIRGQGLSEAYAQRLAEGHPLFSYYLREFEGFDSETGQPIQEDIQKFVGKSALPDVTAGLSTNFRYNDWSLSAYFNGQFGNYIYNNTANAFFTAGAFRGARNVLPETLTAGESLDAAAEVSTRFLEKGDFVRLQSLTLGYNIPLPEDSFLDTARLSLTGQNLFVITDYSGLDPEVSVAPGSADLLNGLPVFGIDYTGFPRPRTFTLGINAAF